MTEVVLWQSHLWSCTYGNTHTWNRVWKEEISFHYHNSVCITWLQTSSEVKSNPGEIATWNLINTEGGHGFPRGKRVFPPPVLLGWRKFYDQKMKTPKWDLCWGIGKLSSALWSSSSLENRTLKSDAMEEHFWVWTRDFFKSLSNSQAKKEPDIQ